MNFDALVAFKIGMTSGLLYFGCFHTGGDFRNTGRAARAFFKLSKSSR